MSDVIETRATQVNGHEVTVTLVIDTDNRPEHFDCYSPEDIDAWKRDLWEFVGVIVSMPYGEASVWGVEYGHLGDFVIGMAQIIESHVFDLVTEILANKPRPVGGEPFGTQVTFWSTHWGVRCAIITSSPKPVGERDFLDAKEWGIVLKPDRSGGGMTFAPADQLTLGWHPDAN